MTAPSTLVRTEIERFLRSPNPEVLCISGAWGVGKTYLWKEVLTSTAKSATKPTLRDYSYVSLFGVDSLEGLRQAIFSNQTSFSEDKVVKGWSFSKKAAKSAQSLLEELPKVGALFSALGALYFSSVRKMVICIEGLRDFVWVDQGPGSRREADFHRV
jgi:Cdc6-like AAA superfamily ATPase